MAYTVAQAESVIEQYASRMLGQTLPDGNNVRIVMPRAFSFHSMHNIHNADAALYETSDGPQRRLAAGLESVRVAGLEVSLETSQYSLQSSENPIAEDVHSVLALDAVRGDDHFWLSVVAYYLYVMRGNEQMVARHAGIPILAHGLYLAPQNDGESDYAHHASLFPSEDGLWSEVGLHTYDEMRVLTGIDVASLFQRKQVLRHVNPN